MNLSEKQIQTGLDQAKALGIDTKDLHPSSITDTSRLVDTLYQRVVEQEIFENEYSYVLTKLFPLKMVINGSKEFMYNAFTSAQALSAYDDASIDDFKGDTINMLAEIAVADTEFGKKIEIPNQMLFDMFVKPNGVSKFIALIRQNVAFAIEQVIENDLWTKVIADAVEEKVALESGTKVESLEGIKAIKKEIVSVIKSLKTTSKKHKYVGTDGVITIEYQKADGTKETKDIQPVKKFDLSEFILVRDINLDLNERFNGASENYIIEYEGQSYEVGSIESVDFSIYDGLEQINDAEGTKLRDAITLPTGFQALLIHRDALHPLEFFNTSTEIPKTNKPATIYTIFEYMTIYKRKDVPMVIFTAVDGALKTEVKKGKVETKSKEAKDEVAKAKAELKEAKAK